MGKYSCYGVVEGMYCPSVCTEYTRLCMDSLSLQWAQFYVLTSTWKEFKPNEYELLNVFIHKNSNDTIVTFKSPIAVGYSSMLIILTEVLEAAAPTTAKKPRQLLRCPVCGNLKKGHKFILDCPRNTPES